MSGSTNWGCKSLICNIFIGMKMYDLQNARCQELSARCLAGLKISSM